MPRSLQSPEAEFKVLAARGTDDFAREFTPLLRAIIAESPSERDRARARLARVIGQTMTLADAYGRRRALLEFDAAVSRLTPEDAVFRYETPVVPNVPFSEAYADILRREPRLAFTAEEVAKLYQEQHAFALAKSADLALTNAVKGHVVKSIMEGTPSLSASAILREMGDFTRSYASTVYTTNLTTAYTAGRFQQAQEPGVREMLPAMERWSVTDSAVRQGREQDHGENHLAAHGLIADTNDRIWQTHATPSGYRCRCGVTMVPLPRLRRLGLMSGTTVLRYEPPGLGRFRAHANFGRRRPDLAIYGGGSIV
jgi:hypothetical protein